MEIQRRCNKCKKEQSIHNFGSNRTQPLGKSYMCILCRRNYDKQRYDSDPEAIRQRTYKSRRKTEKLNKEKLYRLLENEPCVDCGLIDPIVMEFDHTDASSKKYNIGAMIGNSYSWVTILEEIAKCDIVCANCHRHRTMNRGNWWRVQVTNEMA